jgi:hypothetical protein
MNMPSLDITVVAHRTAAVHLTVVGKDTTRTQLLKQQAT